MAITVANLAVSLSARTKGFNKGLGKAEKRLNKFVGGVGRMGAKLAAAGAVATGVGLALGVKLASDLEQAEVAFETMIGSGEKARRLLAEMTRFAAKTPFRFEGVVDAGRQLLAYGVEQDQVIPQLRMLGDIAAGVGMDKLPRLILAYGQVKAATRLTGMELRQFTEAGVPLLDEIGKQMGKTAAQIKDMISSGEVSFGDVQRAMVALTQEGGRFNNLMEKQSKTLGGLFSTFKDEVSFVLRDVGMALLPALKNIVIEVNSMMPNLREVSLQLVPMLASGAQMAANQVGRIGTAIAFATNVFKTLEVGGLRVLIVISEWADTVKNFADNVSITVGAAMGSIYNLTVQVGRNIGSVFMQVGANIVRVFTNVGEVLGMIFDGVFTAIAERDFSHIEVALFQATKRGITRGLESIRVEPLTKGVLPELISLDKDSGFTSAFKKALAKAEKDLSASTGLAGNRFEEQAGQIEIAANSLDAANNKLRRQTMGRTLGANEFVDIAKPEQRFPAGTAGALAQSMQSAGPMSADTQKRITEAAGRRSEALQESTVDLLRQMRDLIKQGAGPTPNTVGGG